MKYDLIHVPDLSSNSSNIDYFWHQIPYGFPALVSSILGIFLFFLGIYTAVKRENKRFYIYFALYCFSFAFYCFMFFLRAEVKDKELLLRLHYLLYTFVVIAPAIGSHLILSIMSKKRLILRVSQYFIWGSALLAIYSLITHKGFTGNWYSFNFGLFPVGDMYLKQWGVLSSLIFVVLFLPIFYFTWKKGEFSIHPYVFWGINLLGLGQVSSLPPLIGHPIYPIGVFSFIPMLLLAYGVFHSDCLNLNELLFKRFGLFYVSSFSVSILFLLMSVGIATFLRPDNSTEVFTNSYFLVPLFSGLCIFMLAVYIAGTNPGEKLNMLVSSSLIMNGILMIIQTLRAINLNVIAEQRLVQVCYVFYAFMPCIQFRLFYHAMEEKPPKVIRVIDLLCVIFSVLALTPYFINGYYQYSFGRISSSGIVLKFASIFWMACLILVFHSWFKFKKHKNKHIGNFVILSMGLGGLLTLSNIPGTIGIPIYPLSNVQFISAAILALGVFRYGAIPVRGDATIISNRLTAISLVFVPVAMYLYYSTIKGMIPLRELIFHICLIAVPLMISLYMFTYILTRPMAKKLDENFHDLLKEVIKEKETVVSRTNSLKNLLDNAGQGFLSIGADLIVKSEYSIECERILGSGISGRNIADLLYPDTEYTENREFIKTVLMDILNETSKIRISLDVLLQLLENEVFINGKCIKIDYRLVESSASRQMMIVLTDITEKKLLENHMEAERNTLRMIVKLVSEYIDFKYLLKEYEEFYQERLREIVSRNMEAQKAGLEILRFTHTFKGSFSQYYMANSTSLLNEIENKITSFLNRNSVLNKKELADFISTLQFDKVLIKDTEIIENYLGKSFINQEKLIQVSEEKLIALEVKLDELLIREEKIELIPEIRKLRYRSFKDMLKTYPDYTLNLARRLEKSINPFIIDGDEIPVDFQKFYDFAKSLVHVFRNIADHGIESPEERMDNGKSEYGSISCLVKLIEDKIILTISDDGRGIDTENLKAALIEKNICSPEEVEKLDKQSLLQNIFRDGISTRKEANEISGRGVGLSAVKEEVLKLSGTVEVQTHPAQGSEFKFILPYFSIYQV